MTTFLRSTSIPALLGLAALLAGCGSSGSSGSSAPAAAKTTAATAAGKTVEAASKRGDGDGDGIPDAITVKGKVGDTLALEGSGLNSKDPSDHTKTKIRVTLKRMIGPFKGYQIASNRKLIGLELHFVNVGTLRYDNALPGGQLSLRGGETGKQTSLIQLGGKNPCPNPSLKLKTGQSKDVCIAFEVPKSGKPQAFQYVSDSGYGDTGLWALR
jgi:hypothetical protein